MWSLSANVLGYLWLNCPKGSILPAILSLEICQRQTVLKIASDLAMVKQRCGHRERLDNTFAISALRRTFSATSAVGSG